MERGVRLRPELEIIRTGSQKFLLSDPRSGALFEFTAEERYLLHVLESAGSPEEAVRAWEERFGPGMSRRRVLEFIEQLRQQHLLVEAPYVPETAVASRRPAASPAPPVPLSRDDPAARLNFFFDLLVVLFGWMMHPIWVVPVLLSVALAFLAAVRHQDQFVGSMALLVKALPLLPFLVVEFVQTILFVNLPRMLFIGMVCRRFGGRIRSFRFQLYEGVIPGFYCDTGESFAVLSDQGRWTLLWAMIWPYLAIGSVAVNAWAACRPGSGAGAFWVWLVPPCTVGTLLNFIIFYEFGGYWLLNYAVEEPRLCERALAETRAWLAWRPSPEPLTRGQRYWFRLYGLCYYAFHLVFDCAVWILLGSWMMARLKGVGGLLFALLILWWYADYVGRILFDNALARTVGRGFLHLGSALGLTSESAAMQWLVRSGGTWWFRWSVRLGIVAGLVWIGLLPYNYEIVGECRALPPSQYGVRAQLNDEIVKVHVSEGDYVYPGTVIASLSGRATKADILTTEAELKKAEASLDLLLTGPLSEELQMAADKVKLYQAQVVYCDAQLLRDKDLFRNDAAAAKQLEMDRKQRDIAQEQLLGAQENLIKLKQGYRPEQVRAQEAQIKALEEKLKYYKQLLPLTEMTTPVGGIVITPYMEQRQGQRAKVGDLIAVVQDTSKLRVEVAADDAAAMDIREGMRVNVRLYGMYGRLLTGRVERLAPAAEQDGQFGNPPTRTDSENLQERQLNTRTRDGDYHLRVYVVLDEYPPNLTSEMYGYARIVVDEDDVFWRAVARPVVRFLRTQVWSWLP